MDPQTVTPTSSQEDEPEILHEGKNLKLETKKSDLDSVVSRKRKRASGERVNEMIQEEQAHSNNVIKNANMKTFVKQSLLSQRNKKNGSNKSCRASAIKAFKACYQADVLDLMEDCKKLAMCEGIKTVTGKHLDVVLWIRENIKPEYITESNEDEDRRRRLHSLMT